MRKTIVFVPGSFRPPTAGHWDMISHYSEIADYVVVLVSRPLKSVRDFSESGAGMTAEKSKAILDVFKARFGRSNVIIRISEKPSPVRDMLDAISGLTAATVVIGTSDKDNDSARYGWVAERFADREDLKVLDPASTAYHVKTDVSASDIRAENDWVSAYMDALPERLLRRDKDMIREIVAD